MTRKHLSFERAFFDRHDESDDHVFYSFDRFVTHIDDEAISSIHALYEELGVDDGDGDVLDICSSWTSHMPNKPGRLVLMGMNAAELAANEMADEWTIRDLNTDPTLPFQDSAFDVVTCAASIDYLCRPLEIFAEAARVVRPGGLFVCTFSDRCFPTKAIRGWLSTDGRGRCSIVSTYFEATEGFDDPVSDHRNPGAPGDPLYAVWARRV